MSSDSVRPRDKGNGDDHQLLTPSPVSTPEGSGSEPESESPPNAKLFIADLHLGCKTLEYAEIVRRALSVEPELRPTLITRTMTSDQDGTLHIHFEAVDIKSLRASVGSILELAQVSLQTITELALQPA